MMFGSAPPFEYERPFAAFLLPSFFDPFKRRRLSAAASRSSAWSEHGHGSSPPSSNRSSIASAPSEGSGEGSVDASLPSLCSLPPDHVSMTMCTAARAYRSSPTPHVGAQDPRDPQGRHLTRAVPDTLRCVKCAADIAFAAQIVSKGFTGRYGRAYLVSAPPTAAGHLLAPEVAATDRSDRSDRSASEPGGLLNVRLGSPENRHLVTGAHVVADIRCAVCRSKLGWKYVDSRDAAQRYKVGKFILETARVARYRGWEDDDGAAAFDFLSGELRAPDPVGADSADSHVVADPVGAVRRLLSKNVETQPVHPALDDAPIEFDSEDDDECDELFAGTWDAAVVAKRRGKKLAARGK